MYLVPFEGPIGKNVGLKSVLFSLRLSHVLFLLPTIHKYNG